jgi:hypothetical protein
MLYQKLHFFLGPMNFYFNTPNFDQEEALRYQPGQRVELKARPGMVDVIAEYDPMMVPPIWLANDPKPRYPHELNVLPKAVIGNAWLRVSRRNQLKPLAQPPRCHLTPAGRVRCGSAHG